MGMNSTSSTTPTSWQPPTAIPEKGQWQCECGKTLRFAWNLSGKKGRCPSCGRRFTIPALDPVEGAVSTLRGHNGAIRAVAVSPDRRLVATAAEVSPSAASKSELAETLLWDTESGLALISLHWHRDSVLALAFSPDGRLLATAGKDRTISIWNIERGLWDAVIGAHERALYEHEAPLSAIAFSPDGTHLVSAATDQTLRFWNTKDWSLVRTIDVGRHGEGQIAFSPCGRYLASVWSSRGPATLWKMASGERHLDFRLPTEEQSEDRGVGFSADGAQLIVLSQHEVRLWDISTCQVLASFEAPGSEALAVSPRAKVIATGGLEPETNANVTLWDPASLIRTREFDGHTQPVSTVAFSPDGKLLISGGRDGVANVWQVG
jgi:WD40 repeat protein